MKLNEAVLGALFCALGTWMIVYSTGLPKPRHLQYGPGLFPSLLGGGLVICGVFQIVFGLVQGRAVPIIERPVWMDDRRLVLNLIAIPAAFLFYYFAAETLGFFFTGLAILCVMLLVGGIAPIRAAVVSMIMITATTMIFASILHVPLSWGVLAPISGWFIW